MRTTISKEVQFDSGHRVPDHASKCRHPHGHRYRVVATCSGVIVCEPGAPDNGMVVDFGDLKRWLTELVHDQFDHAFLVHKDDPFADYLLGWRMGGEDDESRIVFLDWVPTAENMAVDVFARLGPVVAEHWRDVELVRVEVWETPTSMASCEA